MENVICGIRVDGYSFDEVVDLAIDQAISKKLPEYIVTPNAHHIVTLQQDAYFRKIYEGAFLSVPDGVPLLWAAKLLGNPLNGRVNGTDLLVRLCEVSAEKGLSVFFLGGRPGAAEAAVEVLQKSCSGLKVAGTYCPPYGFENDETELENICSAITSASPDLLFVGLGAPKQEKWIYDYYRKINVPVSVGIGVSFELVSGMVQRAPVIMQKTGMEWLFRLVMEPGRLWKRYIFGNVIFVSLVLKQKLGFFKS